MKLVIFAAVAVAAWFAQASPTPDLSPFAYYGIAGLLLAFILWLYIDERKEHKALRAKVLNDVFPALLANNGQMQQSAEAMERLTLMAHDIAGRPNLDPVMFSEWARTMDGVKRLLERSP